MRQYRAAASIVAAVAAAVSVPAVAQTRGMAGTSVAPPVQARGGWTGGQMRGGTWTGGQARGTWNGNTRTWTGGNWNGNRWVGGARWGNRIGGRWHGGVQAPGGWAAYRQPYRGWSLPSYWFAPSFYMNDYAVYGLGAPPAGYTWTRYYDDAVLVDGRGRVYDSVGGLNWDRYEGGHAYDDGYDARFDDGERYYADGADDAYGPQGPDGRVYDRRDDGRRDRGRRDNGVGGAVIGGVLGGVAGNLIGGRGNRLGGTLIGAGVGAIAGAAIDQAEDRGRDRRRGRDLPPPPPPYAGAPYGYPPAPPPPGHPPVVVQHGGGYHSGGYDTRVYTSGGYGYGYWGGTTTTVTVMPTTTTTTETITVYDNVQTTTRRWRAPVKRTKVLRRTPSKILSRGCNC